MPSQQAYLHFEPKIRDSLLTSAQRNKAVSNASVCAHICACIIVTSCSLALLHVVVQAVNRTGYKWMLYGDDDTIWFVGGVLDVLKDLDPEMPYIITGKQSTSLLAKAALPSTSSPNSVNTA